MIIRQFQDCEEILGPNPVLFFFVVIRPTPRLSEPREQPPILVCGNSSDPPLKRTQGAATNPRGFF